MARARYLIQFFPEIIEEELNEVTLKKMMSDEEQDALTDELGISLFGGVYDPNLGNAEMPSVFAGQLGSKVKEYKDVLEEQIVIKKQKP